MNRYKLSKAGISATEGIARFNGDKDLYEDMLNHFAQDTHFVQLQQAMAARDVTAAFAAAHALKGVAGNLSMKRLFDDVYPLVEALRAGNLADAEPLLPQVEMDYAELLAVLAPTE